MKTEWLRNTIKDFEPYYVAPIAEKYVINANENYFNVSLSVRITVKVYSSKRSFHSIPEKGTGGSAGYL